MLFSKLSSTPRRLAVIGVATCVFLALSATTYGRGRTFRTVEQLWRDVIEKRPGKARAYLHLGTVYLTSTPPRLDEAETMYRRAAALDSTNASVWYHLAEVALSRGRETDAEQLLRAFLARDSHHDKAARWLGSILLSAANAPAAVPLLKKANKRGVGGAGSGRRLCRRGRSLESGEAARGNNCPADSERARIESTWRVVSPVWTRRGGIDRATESANGSSVTAYSLTVCGWAFSRASRAGDAKAMFERAPVVKPGYMLARAALDRLRSGQRPVPSRPQRRFGDISTLKTMTRGYVRA
jgi:tetratricopeptide (TPR) repeat protein